MTDSGASTMTDEQALAPRDTALDRLLSDPGALRDLDVAKVTEIHRIHRIEVEDARRLAFHAAFEAAQAELSTIPILKDTAGDRGSRFAKVEKIVKVLDPVLVRHGFSWSFSDADSPVTGHIRIVMTLRGHGHVETHGYTCPAWDGRGAKGGAVMTPLQASGAMRTYSERRLRMSVFGLHLVDDDHDGAATGDTDPITADQVADLDSMIEEVGADRGRFLEWLGVEHLAKLPARDLRRATQALEQKRRAR